MRYAVLHGPRSGRGGAGALGRQVTETLRERGQQVTELETSTLEAAREACRRAIAEGVEVLAVVGGDGVVSLAADVLAKAKGASRPALGVVPSGTGNDNARSLGIPLRHAGAIDTLLRGRRRTVDLIHIPELDRHVMGSVPAGLDALIAARAATLPKWLGPASYAAATLPEIARLRPMQYRLTLDGRLLEVTALVVAACNMPIYGGGMRIAPDADPTDGLLDVVIITPVGPVAALTLLAGVFTGRHTRHASVRMERARTVRMEGPDVLAHGDGEPLLSLPLTASAVPGRLGRARPALTDRRPPPGPAVAERVRATLPLPDVGALRRPPRLRPHRAPRPKHFVEPPPGRAHRGRAHLHVRREAPARAGAGEQVSRVPGRRLVGGAVARLDDQRKAGVLQGTHHPAQRQGLGMALEVGDRGLPQAGTPRVATLAQPKLTPPRPQGHGNLLTERRLVGRETAES